LFRLIFIYLQNLGVISTAPCITLIPVEEINVGLYLKLSCVEHQVFSLPYERYYRLSRYRSYTLSPFHPSVSLGHL